MYLIHTMIGSAQLDLIYGKLDKNERNYFPFWTWTTQWKQTITWRLLNVAQIGNISERAKAVRTLASLQDLSGDLHVYIIHIY